MPTAVADVTTAPIAAQIEAMVRDVPGWSPLDQLMALFTLAFSSPLDGDIVEVGSWCGRSTTALGLAARLTGRTRVYAVDLFPEKSDWRENADGTYSLTVTIDGERLGAYEQQTVWAEPYLRDIAPIYRRHPALLATFQEVIARNGLRDIVRPFRGDLRRFTAAAPAGLRCKLAFIDGDHSYDAVARDIALIEPYLVPGAWLCFDDAFSTYDGVDQAIRDHVVASGRYDRCQQLTRKCYAARRAR